MMQPHLIPGLTTEAASHICMHECMAMCCRGALILRLTAQEALAFREQAAALGVALQMRQAPDGGGWVRFSEHAGERCPMLDAHTYACRIYEDRPQRCRDFPERPTPGCAISGFNAMPG
jgi:Fe-S-cluster containining protein